MGRRRIYASGAERQKAYRQRQSGQQIATPQPQGKRPRPASRPARLATVQSAIVKLFDEYEDWLASMPESLQNSGQGQRVSETVDQLASVIDLISEIELPRGFGRD